MFTRHRRNKSGWVKFLVSIRLGARPKVTNLPDPVFKTKCEVSAFVGYREKIKVKNPVNRRSGRRGSTDGPYSP
jgi:hypothetical protein